MNRAVAASVAARPIPLERDPDVLACYLEDAAHFPGGRATALARPVSIEEVAWTVRHAQRLLPVGAQSSLTGGATPAGDVVLSTERLTTTRVNGDRVIAGAGVRLRDLQDTLARHGRWFPPVPTFLGATVGGAIATNAAGAATFKYGAVRQWVHALSVVLANGDLLRITRGEVQAEDGHFALAMSDGERRVDVPSVVMPQVAKCSAGFYAAKDMDLVDLFIGSEGTLGVIVEAELDVRPRPGVCWMLVALSTEAQAIALTHTLREERSIEVAAIEHIDRRCLEILRQDGADKRLGVQLDANADVLLLVQFEVDQHQAEHGLNATLLDCLASVLERHGVADGAEIVLPSNPRRAAAFVDLRESVPAGVNRRVALAHAADPRVHKTAADMIVPFAQFESMMRECRDTAASLDLDLAVWGHISDGNVHPNVVPRDYADVERGKQWILQLAARVIAMGGSPLAEHGVGRNRVKQRLLTMLYGPEGVASMYRTKLSLDPAAKLAAGLLFETNQSRDVG